MTTVVVKVLLETDEHYYEEMEMSIGDEDLRFYHDSKMRLSINRSAISQVLIISNEHYHLSSFLVLGYCCFDKTKTSQLYRFVTHPMG